MTSDVFGETYCARFDDLLTVAWISARAVFPSGVGDMIGMQTIALCAVMGTIRSMRRAVDLAVVIYNVVWASSCIGDYAAAVGVCAVACPCLVSLLLSLLLLESATTVAVVVPTTIVVACV